MLKGTEAWYDVTDDEADLIFLWKNTLLSLLLLVLAKPLFFSC